MMHMNEVRIEKRQVGKLEKNERLDRKGVRTKDREEKRNDGRSRKPEVLTSVQGLSG
jgi:hypothetical protein